jgi:hypothetical protein
LNRSEVVRARDSGAAQEDEIGSRHRVHVENFCT